jgi:hypothetical protein
MWDFKETYAVETKKEKLKEVIQDDYIIIEVPARVGGGPVCTASGSGSRRGPMRSGSKKS